MPTLDLAPDPAEMLRTVIARILDQRCRASLRDLKDLEWVADTLGITADVQSLAAEIEKAMSFPGDTKSQQLKAVRRIVRSVQAEGVRDAV